MCNFLGECILFPPDNSTVKERKNKALFIQDIHLKIP